MIPLDADIAWAAGLFEGEGSFAPMQQRGRQSVSLIAGLAMTDEDVVRRFHAIVGVGNVTFRRRNDPRHKDQWVWQSAAIDDVRFVIRMFAPWLGERRSAKVTELLEAYANSPARRVSKTHCPHGHEYTPENTHLDKNGWRKCMECQREAGRRQHAKAKSI